IVSQNVCITNFGIIGTASNSIFNNNIILGQINLASTGTGNVIKNNYIKTTLRVHGSHLRNNLVKGGIITDNGNNDSYNISDVGTGISDYFKSDASSSDGEYMLSDTSPAKNSGEDGVDCGPFGGTNPYVLSGIPKGPHIYDATIGTSANKEDGLDISIKIKTQL
ncbi:MAG: hypothetical protein KAG37_02620, partial [Flavobacteriales bacterium]|nr:hypothetical protein [Flavobacteriales bacterium]